MLIHRQLFDDLPAHSREAAEVAFVTLSLSGIWDAAIQLEQSLLLKGSVTEDPAELAVRILESRKRVNLLTELQALGLKIQKDKSNEHNA